VTFAPKDPSTNETARFAFVESSTGDLLSTVEAPLGSTPAAPDPSTQDVVPDPPVGAITRGQEGQDTFHRWQDPDWVVVAVASELDLAKAAKTLEIDLKTEDLITSLGFTHNGRVFSTSPNAQSKWHAIQIMNLMGQITWPPGLSISDKSETSYEIADSAELSTMYATMVGTGKAHHDSGKALKDAVTAATTVAEVEAIQDNR